MRSPERETDLPVGGDVGQVDTMMGRMSIFRHAGDSNSSGPVEGTGSIKWTEIIGNHKQISQKHGEPSAILNILV